MRARETQWACPPVDRETPVTKSFKVRGEARRVFLKEEGAARIECHIVQGRWPLEVRIGGRFSLLQDTVPLHIVSKLAHRLNSSLMEHVLEQSHRSYRVLARGHKRAMGVRIGLRHCERWIRNAIYGWIPFHPGDSTSK